MEAKALLKSIFATDNPAEASRGSTGEVEAKAPPKRERREGDYLPVICTLAGVGLMVWAMLGSRSQSRQNPHEGDRNNQYQDGQQETSNSDW